MPVAPRASAAARCSAIRVATSAPRSASASQVPFDPSVQMHKVTTAPAAAHLASVAPAPNSMSSGWAPMARTRTGVGRSTEITGAPSAARG